MLLGFAFFWRVREHEAADVADFMIAALSFTMATPVVWTHHYGMIYRCSPSVPALLARSPRDRAGLFWLAVAYLLLANVYDAVIFTRTHR